MHDRDDDGLRGHWERVYAEKAEQEVSWFQEVPATSLRLVAATGAGRDARIVDVGGGASRLVDALLADGYGRITVLDLAAPALDRARQRLGPRAASVSWIAADVTSWTPDGTYDVWHDRAVFHFLVRPEHRAAYRATLLRALGAGGHAIVATFAADGPERCSGLPVARYDPDALAAELGPELRLVESLREEHRTPGGKVQRFQYSRFVRA
ncbi:MAG TPA: class I SAM-dependent methyltransferase [Anaeromyxobacter sp.]|nr:class I SAM-dependent methyltransferase [Anaeromyxobacter sp.]